MTAIKKSLTESSLYWMASTKKKKNSNGSNKTRKSDTTQKANNKNSWSKIVTLLCRHLQVLQILLKLSYTSLLFYIQFRIIVCFPTKIGFPPSKDLCCLYSKSSESYEVFTSRKTLTLLENTREKEVLSLTWLYTVDISWEDSWHNSFLRSQNQVTCRIVHTKLREYRLSCSGS